MEDLTAASLDDIASFFATYYTPDNAVLSIAGDVDLATARPMVEQYFGAIPRGTGRPPLRPMDVSPRFESPRREVVPDDVRLPRLYLAFRTPVFGSPEYYVASVCGAVLGMRRGSRLHRTLVRERQIAADATAFTSRSRQGQRPPGGRRHRAARHRRRTARGGSAAGGGPASRRRRHRGGSPRGRSR